MKEVLVGRGDLLSVPYLLLSLISIISGGVHVFIHITSVLIFSLFVYDIYNDTLDRMIIQQF